MTSRTGRGEGLTNLYSLPINRTVTRLLVLWMLSIAWASVHAQTPPQLVSSGVTRIEGTDPDNRVSYVRFFLTGTLVPPVEITPPPTLTAQCTLQPSGKLAFELFANFGGIEDRAYHRPWMPKDGGPFAPQTTKTTVTMEFLGYTRVKPVKRQWELVEVPRGQLRYNPPSTSSSNMEEISFYLRYLNSLPTLRLTFDGKTAEFLVTPLFDQIRKEPACHASGL